MFSMSAESEIEEIAMEVQDLGGTESATVQTMDDEIPLRNVSSLFGLDQLESGNVQYVDRSSTEDMSQSMERPRSVSPSLRLVVQGTDVRNDRITDIIFIQNVSLTISNGSDDGVGDNDNERQEEGREVSYSEVVLGRLSVEQVKEVVSVLVESPPVPVEKWAYQTPERIVSLIRKMLKNRDYFITEGVRVVRLALGQEHNRRLSLSQEIVNTEETV